MDEPAWVTGLREKHKPWTITTTASVTSCLLDSEPWPCTVTRLIWSAWGEPALGTDGEGGPPMAAQIDNVSRQRDVLEGALGAVRGAARQLADEAAATRQQAASQQRESDREGARRTVREAVGLERAVAALLAAAISGMVPRLSEPPRLPRRQSDGAAMMPAAPLWELAARWRQEIAAASGDGEPDLVTRLLTRWVTELDEVLTWEGP